MIRSSLVLRRVAVRQLSTTKATSTSTGPTQVLEADSGKFATHIHHHMTTFLVFATPLYFVMPTPDMVDKAVGSALAVTIAGHSWIGLNYVATDYVPKISKSLLGPARLVNAAIGVVTLLGMTAIAWNGKGGIKTCVTGMWTKKKTEVVVAVVE